MGSNTFGSQFQITTWGESHGKAMGVVIDGCPAGLEISEEEIAQELALRQPGKSPFTSPRMEEDKPEIFSGVFDGKTTGAPISIIIFNKDTNPSHYEPLKNSFRPGHANFTYMAKYGVFDYRGGGRSSARETVCRVAAGAIAKKLLLHFGIHVAAYIADIGEIKINPLEKNDLQSLKKSIYESPLFCPDKSATAMMMIKLEEAKKMGDSLGGIVEFAVMPLPVGLGDPVYEKLEANLAKAMLSIPASKGFEIGSGFQAAKMKGSEHNDAFVQSSTGKVITATNHAGGTLGGISNGMPLYGRVAFKPTSSIQKPQMTVTTTGEEKILELPPGSRHDPCLAIRAVPVVEAMTALVLVDALLLNRNSKL